MVQADIGRFPSLERTKTSRSSALADSELGLQSPPVFTADRPRRSTEGSLGIGGSIRRKLREVKDASANIARGRPLRHFSVPTFTLQSTGLPAAGESMGHHRAQSEGLRTRPVVLPTASSTMSLSLDDHEQTTPPAMDLLSDPPDAQEEPTTPAAQESPSADVTVPQILQHGVPMLKVSAKKQKYYVFRIDPDQGQIVWVSKKLRIIPIENIKELRSGTEARYYREQFQLAQQYEDRWLTIVYVLDGGYKTLHLLAATQDVFRLWDGTVRRLYAIRQKLMSGLGHADMRQAVWEKQFWRGAGPEPRTGADQKLDFDEVERMCRRLNINPSREDLYMRFKEADSQDRGYLDFADFKQFVKALKARPDIDRLYRNLVRSSGGAFTFITFESFMCCAQKSSMSQPELQRIFLRYASPPQCAQSGSPHSSPLQTSLDLAVQAASVVPKPEDAAEESRALAIDSAIMTKQGFTSFLLSTDNSAFSDQHGKIFHDMTRPLPEYFISSSHNTYLVGHQLVGASTVEGYIRALLHSCRSVELDIYDGDTEPMVYHGHTLTTKVLLRDACAAIAKYAFVVSPYPIIISAEIHCSVPQQDMIAQIMIEEFGPALVRETLDGRLKIDVLPSPEELKGRVLLKAKNLYVSEHDPLREREISVDTESSTETSASDSDFSAEVKHEWRKVRENEAEVIKDLKYEFHRARHALGRVRPPREVPPSPKPFVGTALPGSPRLEARDSSLPPKTKVKMSFALAALLVYTVGIKCRGINKKEVYAPEHMFSLSESTTNRIIRQGSMTDLIKHNRTHLVRTYPKGMRIGSTNYEPHRFWATGAQLVAMNWQTFDLGYMINHAMFQRNGRTGYVLKPLALRSADKQLLGQRSNHCLEIVIISAQQLPRPKDSLGREIIDKSVLDPFIEVSIHVPDWPQASQDTHSSASTSSHAPHSHSHSHLHVSHPHLHSHSSSSASSSSPSPSPHTFQPPASTSSTQVRTTTVRTCAVKNNGFNPVWEQRLQLPFTLVGDMRDLVFVRFAVKQDGRPDEEPLAVYCASLGSLNLGYRHLPLHDGQLSQYLFSTLFVNIDIRDI